MTDEPSLPRSSPLAPLGWGVFLAVSWTWCIGMFLPVLLVHDYGVWGWIVFAIPNVIGAAAMGWVLRSADDSRAMVEAHRPGLVAFSFVTTAFQTFFAFWMFARIGMPFWTGVVAVTALIVLVLTINGRPTTGVLLSVMIYVISLLCIVKAMQTQELSLRPWFVKLDRPPTGALLLAPVCFFGFVLCPYLDLTFHRARQELSRAQARAAFTVGFGVFFLAMIVFTLAYAAKLMGDPRVLPGQTFLWWVCLHMAVQLGFTVGIHWSNAAGPMTSTRANLRAYALVNGSLLIGFLAYLASRWVHVGSLEGGELIYRLFLAFYGLVFPAYVWICAVGAARSVPDRRRCAVFVIAVVLAAPFFWMGFIGGQMVYLSAGLAVVLLARFAVTSRSNARLAA